MNVYQAYAAVGGISAGASFLIACGSLFLRGSLTDSGMWAIAVMTLAPALMGLGVSLFICLSHRAEPPPGRRLPPDESRDPDVFTSSHR